MDSVNQAKEYLDRYIKRSAPLLKKYLDEQLKLARDISRTSQEPTGIAGHLVATFRGFMGGKNIRGALVCLGYEAAGGDSAEILKVSLAIQILQSFLLIHDDIMDEDELRRGHPTVHRTYEGFHQERGIRGDPKHYGMSMAIDLGDIGAFMGVELLASANLPAERKTQAIVACSRYLVRTAFGQAMDITYEHRDNLTEADVLRVHLYKTAHYTIVGPLGVGAILAGADRSVLDAIDNYGQPVGVAFQLWDDELGLFSDETKLGKPIGSDIREGKNTLLRVKAMELGSEAERQFLRSAYGNTRITAAEVLKVQDITRKVGALEYSQTLSRKLVDRGERVIPKITSDVKYRQLLHGFAELMISRES
jgi:geranylgeranyl diphosphate synthase type I